ncbi:methionine synthase [Anoxybacter fermentans]|uniref:Methionine synthase n=1 Tax=Anoxybacter fermentans TaxID=1323375 RepID=A0A3S9SWI4_9FIRM|nr:methionine synthase [Anoxybacter fermentans]AZR72687.1 methionine synthase [Anoxybacter fermentans]
MVFTNLYIPEIHEIMPSKRVYLFRAGFKGKNIILDNVMRNLVNSIYTRGLEISEPKLYYTTLPIGDIPPEIIPASFAGSQRMTIFVSTLGKRIDKEIEAYAALEKVLHATLLDAWGSEALETLNKSFDNKLRSKYGKGTRRFSPGYGDIDIRLNSLILELLQVHDVVANPKTGILLPRKSTICMIGWQK